MQFCYVKIQDSSNKFVSFAKWCVEVETAFKKKTKEKNTFHNYLF